MVGRRTLAAAAVGALLFYSGVAMGDAFDDAEAGFEAAFDAAEASFDAAFDAAEAAFEGAAGAFEADLEEKFGVLDAQEPVDGDFVLEDKAGGTILCIDGVCN